MWWAVLAAELLALGCAARLAILKGSSTSSKDRQLNVGVVNPRPLVLLLAFAVVVDVLIAVGDCRVLGSPHAVLAVVVPCVPPVPRGGLVSAVVLAEQALVMAWPCAVWAAASSVFGPRKEGLTLNGAVSNSASLRARPREYTRRLAEGLGTWKLALIVWLVAVAALVFGRPYGHPGATAEAREARALFVARLLLAVELAAVAGGAVAAWRAWTPTRRWGRSWVHAAMLVLLVTELAVATIGPFVRDPFSDWDYARALYLVGFVTAAAVLARGSAGRRPASP